MIRLSKIRFQYSTVIARLLIGAAIGAFLGITELWNDRHSARYIVANCIAGASGGALFGLMAVRVSSRAAIVALGGLSGVLGGLMWIVVIQVLGIEPIAIGAALGLLFAWSELGARGTGDEDSHLDGGAKGGI